jgi:phenylacetate-CoA ligase
MDARMSEATDADRYPGLTESGRAMLDAIREHSAAPVFRNQSGHRLQPADLAALEMFERNTLMAPIRYSEVCTSAASADWLADFLASVYRDVPYYRALGSAPRHLADAPVISRASLAREIASFVPDTAPLDRLINFRTTGTTGHPLLVASHPRVAAGYLVFHKRALARRGITLTHGAGQTGVMLLGFQKTCFTYMSVTPQMGESALIKINLHTDDWRDPGDRARFIDAMAPEVIAGDPLSFAEYLSLGVRHKPRAALSVSMALSAGFKAALESALGCPVLDIYSMNEAGPIASYDEASEGHLLLQPRMVVETLGADGNGVPRGARGEITLTGGFNFCLPLVRYRTGDYGILADTPAGPAIFDLEGRRPVRFFTRDATWINNIDVSHVLKALPLEHYCVHQARDGTVTCALPPRASHLQAEVRDALSSLFSVIVFDTLPASGETKPVQYASDFPGALI